MTIEQEVEKLLSEGKTLVTHATKHPPYKGGKSILAQAENEAGELKLSGAARALYLREREEGWIAPEQFVSVPEAGIAGTPIGEGGTKAKINPQSGRLETQAKPALAASLTGWVGELAEWLKEEMPKVLVNSGLVIVGLVLMVYGLMVAVRPRETAFSVPMPSFSVPL